MWEQPNATNRWTLHQAVSTKATCKHHVVALGMQANDGVVIKRVELVKSTPRVHNLCLLKRIATIVQLLFTACNDVIQATNYIS